MRPFEEQDALLFFGRDEQIDQLLRRLDNTRFVCVVGLSGCGKSSLVRAGLLPALRRGHLAGAGSQWRTCVIRPGIDPLGALASGLNQTLEERDDRKEILRSGQLGLLDASKIDRDAEENLLLVVDQFEELFRFERASEAAEFVDLLLAASREYEPEYRLYVVITLRSDYVGECARFAGLPEVLNQSQYLVPRMTQEQLREAIEGPAALGGIHVEGTLIERLLRHTGTDPDHLPTLQHLLMRMWEELEGKNAATFTITFQEYEEVGGWGQALNRHANTIVADLSDREQALVKRVFQRLTEKTATGREARRPDAVRKLAAVAEQQPDDIKPLLDLFRQEGRNFLTSPDSELTDGSVIDISHESLIRRWDQLKQWVEEEAESADWYRRVEDRMRTEGDLTDRELQSALHAKETGAWNETWAERYATERRGVRVRYSDVERFLEKSAKRRQGELNDLRPLLTDLSYIEKQCAQGFVEELLTDYDRVLRSGGFGDDEWARLAAFARFVRAEHQLLAEHPELTFQQALNLRIRRLQPPPRAGLRQATCVRGSAGSTKPRRHPRACARCSDMRTM